MTDIMVWYLTSYGDPPEDVVVLYRWCPNRHRIGNSSTTFCPECGTRTEGGKYRLVEAA